MDCLNFSGEGKDRSRSGRYVVFWDAQMTCITFMIVLIPLRRDRDYERNKDRYGVEKEGYIPKVKLDYVDEHGRQMTPKEVFIKVFAKFTLLNHQECLLYS